LVLPARSVMLAAFLAPSLASTRKLDEHDECVSSDTNLCMSLDMFASETGYYNIAGHTGSSPDIFVTIDKTYTFDQSDHTNWYHPVGFAYQPDGAHGSTWGGDELPEVEGAGELMYKINGTATVGATESENYCGDDTGDTGLDCYEPEFFYPKDVWTSKKYAAELTITPAVAAASHGGVIYYFCHIHSKMSGKIIIKNSDGSDFDTSGLDNPTELELYSPVVRDDIDATCGTTGVAHYTGGQSMECSSSFLCGDVDDNDLFAQCLQGVDCAMNMGMYSESTPEHHDPVVTFMEQMIPHHLNAINMAKLLLKVDDSEVDEDLKGILWEIINVQNFQVHQFRNYLGAIRGNTGIAPGEVCTMSDKCATGYACNCAHHRRKLLFASTPMHCTCERV